MQPSTDPIPMLDEWLSHARINGVSDPIPMAFVTVGADGRPSARMVGLKRLYEGTLIFSSALWTRKARELASNPHVSLLFYWPEIGRQVHVAGRAEICERALSVELFAERPIAHRLQSIVSRQGEPIDDLEPLRKRHAHLMSVLETPPECPADWGAIRVIPEAIELWQQSADRMHDRLLFEHDGSDWCLRRLAP